MAPRLRTRRIGLIGCVKKKANRPCAAKDLYLSPLFSGRRSFVERSSDEWWVLSAKHGLVKPEQVIAPYEVTLKDAGRPARREWSMRVLAKLDAYVRPATGDIFEIHAGAEYRDYGLVTGLQARGCVVENPTEGMGIGDQLGFYRRRTPTRGEVVAVRGDAQRPDSCHTIAGPELRPATIGAGTRRDALEAFYAMLAELEVRCGGKRRLVECDGGMGWPERGVYFFFEDGELREDGVSPRVVRVGTHALRPSNSTLWGRLSQHKGSAGGSLPGGGNHRGSIFRLHVGTALLASSDWEASIRRSWSVGSTAGSEVRSAEYALERSVSDHIGRMPFLWLEVDDPAGSESDRGVIEAGAIALLSNLDRPPVDPPSTDWLGRRARHRLIRGAGLWNVNHVQEPPGVSFLSLLASRLR